MAKYQNENGGEGNDITSSQTDGVSYSNEAMIRWWQVTVPLTVVTLTLAWFGLKYAQSRQEKKREQVWAELDLV